MSVERKAPRDPLPVEGGEVVGVTREHRAHRRDGDDPEELVACGSDGAEETVVERMMQEHQIRRIPIVDGEGRCIGIVAQADLALKDKPERVSKTVSEISKPEQKPSIAA